MWMLLFLSPYLAVKQLLTIDATKFFALAIGSLTLSLPIGYYVHQVADTVFNPFARHRLLFWRRSAVFHLKAQLGTTAASYRDPTYQAALVFSKVYETSRTWDDQPKFEARIKPELIREEISNRYSYYYARIENGILAPTLGWLLSLLTRQLFWSTPYVLVRPTFSPWWLILPACVVGLLLLCRIPRLFDELDDLEVGLLNFQRPCWPDVT
jgi:hypothetical protein